ncbi:replicative DNA helicase [Spirochaetia bacterium]|nr:replicative DNA helicase [Spirochaetia bacterium]GHU36262.1 replicative DNA helicase [Spirochaetia bacterium]
MVMERMPPHDERAEQSVLGALLIDDGAITVAIQYLRPADFYSLANSRIFDAILRLFEQGTRADLITVTGELRKSGNLLASGGTDYVANLTNVVPSSANIEYYAKAVQQCSLRRSLIRISNDIISRAFDESQDARSILEEMQQQLFALADARQTFSYKSAKELVIEAITIIERLHGANHEYTGIPSGFDTLDKMTRGFQPQELVIIGARPSVGKTAFALSMAAHIAIRLKRPVAFFTLEMSDISLMMRIISSEAMVESNAIRTGFFQTPDYDDIMDASSKIYESPLYVVDMPNMKLLDLRAQARRLRMQQHVEIIFIDYLTLISSENPRLQRHEQIAEISRSLKSLARELDIPIVALSQLTREAEKDRPSLASIRESGAIEQDADVVMFLHRDRETDKQKPEQDPEPDVSAGSKTSLILAKQRNGPVGTIDLLFLPKYTKFVPVTNKEY